MPQGEAPSGVEGMRGWGRPRAAGEPGHARRGKRPAADLTRCEPERGPVGAEHHRVSMVAQRVQCSV